MGKRKNLEGQRFGSLIVIERTRKDKNGNWFLKCKCDCGNEDFEVVMSSLTKGVTKSCGCLKKEMISKANTKHKLCDTRLYRIHRGMLERCYNIGSKHYINYGAKGITMCDEWKNDFLSFYNWATNNGYRDNLSIDRIDFKGDYCPDNCRWATDVEQQNNKCNNIKITIKGETKSLKDWSEISGINLNTLRWRHREGWDVDILLSPLKKRNREIQNEER